MLFPARRHPRVASWPTFALAGPLFAATSGGAPVGRFRQSEQLLPPPTAQRNAAGVPAPACWQNHADCRFEAGLDGKTHRLPDRSTLTYHNPSPDIPTDLRLRLDPENPTVENPRAAAAKKARLQTTTRTLNAKLPKCVDRFPERRDFHDDCDDTTEELTLGEEIWRYHTGKCAEFLMTTKELKAVLLDPRDELAHCDLENNSWPLRPVKARFQLFKEKAEKNPWRELAKPKTGAKP